MVVGWGDSSVDITQLSGQEWWPTFVTAALLWGGGDRGPVSLAELVSCRFNETPSQKIMWHVTEEHTQH